MPISSPLSTTFPNVKSKGKINIAPIAESFREEIKNKISLLKRDGLEAPLLVGILANNDPAAIKYAEWTRKTLEKDGFRYELRQIKEPTDVEAEITKANDDPTVHGLIVYYPIFGQQSESFSGQGHDDYLRDTITYTKDVEGLCHNYRTNLYRNVRYLDYPFNTQKCLLPCTALSVVKILEHLCYNHKEAQGKKMINTNVTIINRSEVVGRPLAAMLANDGATVYSCDIDSIYIFENNGKLIKCDSQETSVESCVKQSQVVITGVPVKSYKIPTEWFRSDVTIVNVSSFKNVVEEEILKLENAQYVPQVGKVTVAMLERNLMRLYENFHHPNRANALKRRGRSRIENIFGCNAMQLYTAFAVTVLLGSHLSTLLKKK